MKLPHTLLKTATISLFIILMSGFVTFKAGLLDSILSDNSAIEDITFQDTNLVPLIQEIDLKNEKTFKVPFDPDFLKDKARVDRYKEQWIGRQKEADNKPSFSTELWLSSSSKSTAIFPSQRLELMWSSKSMLIHEPKPKSVDEKFMKSTEVFRAYVNSIVDLDRVRVEEAKEKKSRHYETFQNFLNSAVNMENTSLISNTLK